MVDAVDAPAEVDLVRLVGDALRARRHALEACIIGQAETVVVELYIHLPTQHVSVKIRSPGANVKTDTS